MKNKLIIIIIIVLAGLFLMFQYNKNMKDDFGIQNTTDSQKQNINYNKVYENN